MFGVIVRRSLSLQRGAFTDLVFFLLLIISCQELIGSSQPIVALVGDDVILPCHLNPSSDAFDLTVEWSKSDPDTKHVFVWRNGKELEPKKHPSFRGRTQMFPEELRHGNVSVKLSKVELSDGGAYRCFIPSLSKDVTVQLLVGAVSSPVVQVSQSSDGVVLQCESKGWYPEPEMFWLDAEGNLLSSALTETLRGPDGLYTVSSRLTVERRHRNTFTCRVTQRDINHSTEDNTTLTGKQEPEDHTSVASTNPSSSSRSHGISALLVCAVLVLVPAVIFAVWKWRQNRLKNRKDHKDKTKQCVEEKTPERDSAEVRVKEVKKAIKGKVNKEVQREEVKE
ncbi:butyrophilin subfamily 2 member A1-like [Halichoeres trimaculatus]|uniref:butyrophilin subfamily 2 member A1-like n=1 Tax=Halichoeres trimaculatus TaxID=147232 RepID=UPI003D9E8F52